MSTQKQIRELCELAQFYSLEHTFHDGLGRFHQASVEAVVAVLRALGLGVKDNLTNCTELLKESKFNKISEIIEPVYVSSGDEQVNIELVLRAQERKKIDCTLILETGEKKEWSINSDAMFVSSETIFENNSYLWKKFSFKVPLGYHTLLLKIGNQQKEAMIIASPSKVYQSGERKFWGIFAPLYALKSKRNFGIGDYKDLSSLMKWVESFGGDFVGTLPLYSIFLKGPLSNPSPYQPISRLFWSEIFIDPLSSPEWDLSDRAKKIFSSSSTSKKLKSLRKTTLVNYPEVYKLKSELLLELSKTFFKTQASHCEKFIEFKKDNEEIDEYAKFCAVYDKILQPWQTWPDKLKEGKLDENSYEKERHDYHVYVQYRAENELNNLKKSVSSKALGYYFDFTVGIHPSGYDAYKYRHLFLTGIDVGAPPDMVFSGGQKWGFPPFHPEKIRKERYKYFIASVKKLMKYSAIVRLDHIMGLHRLYCVPSSRGAEHGLYIHYPADEYYAILSIESHRNKTAIVGEDLGTVPYYVRQTMFNKGVNRNFILWYDFNPFDVNAIHNIPNECLASINTHDMFPFSVFWDCKEIEARNKYCKVPEVQKAMEKKEQMEFIIALKNYLLRNNWLSLKEDAVEAFYACIKMLSSSKAKYLLIELENLCHEKKPQNVPGTVNEYPNWRKKVKVDMETLRKDKRILNLLTKINELRKL